MIDIIELNARLVEQDAELRARLTQIAGRSGGDPATQALIDIVGEGLAAIHERQGNLITLMLQSNS